MDRYQIIRIIHDIPSRRLIVKFQKIKTLFKNTGMANPLINSGDAVLVVYSTNNSSSISMNSDSSESRCKVTTKNPKNNGFQILWQHVADSCSGCLGCICSKGAFLAVILHPKGKAMDGASISFREEQGLMLRKGLDFPNSFHSGWGQLLTKANFNPP